jgi:isopentenyldiphosphate isomerase
MGRPIPQAAPDRTVAKIRRWEDGWCIPDAPATATTESEESIGAWNDDEEVLHTLGTIALHWQSSSRILLTSRLLFGRVARLTSVQTILQFVFACSCCGHPQPQWQPSNTAQRNGMMVLFIGGKAVYTERGVV